MQIKRRAVTVGTTFFLAAATGHVMQNGDAISAKLRGIDAKEQPVLASVEATVATIPAVVPAAKPAPTDAPVTDVATITPPAAAPEEAPAAAMELAAASSETPEPAAVTEAAPSDALPQPVVTASGLPDLPMVEPAALAPDRRLAGRIGKLDAGYVRADTAADANYTVFGIACGDPALTLEPSARAMVKVSLAAPCYPNERVTITHAGLVFAMATDQAGDLEITVPALTDDARVDVKFTSGDTVSATRAVTGLDALARVAIQWQGIDGFHVHAFENGADFNMPGHVSALSPRDRATGEGGFLTVLGDPAVDHPLMAEVYTAPAGTSVTEMLVEAPVTENTCGHLLSGQAVRMVPDAMPTRESLSFAMPGCDATGDSLMLGLAPLAVPAVAVAQSGN